jgi:hypothetical protein
VAGDDIVDVVAVRKSIVTAVGPVLVPARVAATGVAGHAPIRIGCAYGDSMVVDVAAVHVVKVPAVKVIRVSFVADRHVPAAWSVHVVSVILML